MFVHPIHSYVLVLDSVGQYIQVIFLFHNITWFWLKYFEHRWRDLMWQWGLNVRVSSVIEHWQKLMLGRKGDGEEGEGGRWGGREVMWLYFKRSPSIDGVRINNHSMVQAVIFDVCSKTTVNAALKHISNRFKILENIWKRIQMLHLKSLLAA